MSLRVPGPPHGIDLDGIIGFTVPNDIYANALNTLCDDVAGWSYCLVALPLLASMTDGVVKLRTLTI